MFPFLSIRILLTGFVLEALPQRKQLDDVLCGLFENNQSVYAPGVKPKTVVAAEDEFCQEFESRIDDIVIIIECIKSAFNNKSEVIWVKPFKKEVKNFRVLEPPQYSSEDVKQFYCLNFAYSCASENSGV